MFKLLIESEKFVDEFLEIELKEFFSFNVKRVDTSFYEICISSEKELISTVLDLFYYSRLIRNIFLEISEFKELDKIKLDLDFLSKELTFEIDAREDYLDDKRNAEKEIGSIISKYDNLSVNLKNPDLSFKVFSKNKKNYLVLDLIGFDLSKRDYKINHNSSSINTLITNYCLYLMELDSDFKKPFSAIDPQAGLGDVIIESSLFNPRIPLHIKKRSLIPFSKIFKVPLKFPKAPVTKNKFLAVVQNNKVFKLLKENSNYSNSKIKVSQYELDWLDVKFKEEDVNYVITQFPMFKDDVEYDNMQKEFFYQSEFIAKDMICVISKKKINKKYVKKFNLNLDEEISIEIGKQNYYIYLFVK